MIGIIGAGNMGKAMSLRIKGKILISDIDSSKIRFKKSKNVLLAKNNIDLIKRSSIVILAVKPQSIVGVLKEIKPYINKGKLVISIAAGVGSVLIEKILGKARVVRVMPNMPSVVGKGISVITPGKFATRKDLNTVRKIFLNLGRVVEVKENLMHAVTAISGSGPAYYFLFTEILEKSALSLGLKKNLAKELTLATFEGAAVSSATLNIPMNDFIKKVASKGGTTEAALKVFKKKGLEKIVKEAVKRACNRSRELSR